MLEQALSKFTGQSLIKDKYDNFIGGKFVPPVRGQYFDNLSPITGKVVCQVARGTAEDIELALDAAHAAKDGWGRMSPTERSNILLKIADRMEANLDALAMVETIDNGKPIRETTAADIHWRSTISGISQLASARRKARWPRSTTTPSPITSTSRWAWSARSFHGTSRS